MREKAEVVKVIHVSLIYHRNKIDLIHCFTKELIKKGYFYQGIRSGPKMIETGLASKDFNHSIFLLDLDYFEEFKSFCKINDINFELDE
jgi:hypothetical protein